MNFLRLLTAAGSRAVSLVGSRAASRVEPWAFGVLVALTAWCFLMVPSDFNGDPNDYLFIARSLLNDGWHVAGVTAMRAIGYPVFIATTSLGLTSVNTVFFAQAALFVCAVRAFVTTHVRSAPGRSALYLLAALPSVTYLQKLLFPDGLLLSLGLLLLTALARQRWRRALLIALAMTAVKLIFVFTIGLVVLCALRRKFAERRRLGLVVAGLVAASPLGLAVGAAVAFPDIFYLTMLWRPALNEVDVARTIPSGTETLRLADGRDLVIDFAAVRRHAVSLDHAVVFASPLTPATRATVRPAELVAAKRRVLRAMLAQDTAVHLRLAAKYYGHVFFGAAVHDHVDYMIARKALLASVPEARATRHYESELVALPLSTSLGAGFAEQLAPPANTLYALHAVTARMIQWKAFFWLGPLVLVAVWGARRAATRAGKTTRPLGALVPPLLLLHCYASAMAVSAQHLQDRYVALPLVVSAAVLVMLVESLAPAPLSREDSR
ncbi:MAG: hypothetical protein RLZZ15_799 [Verrucomicrobiota bacterium]|jgi:hypothetical protein